LYFPYFPIPLYPINPVSRETLKNKAKLLPQGFDLSFLYVFLSGPSAASVLLFIGDEKQGIGTRAALKKWPRFRGFLEL